MIEICNISKTFEDFSLENISLTIKEKEYLVILGPTGSGKTMLLEIIAGISQPDNGQILVNGKDITETSPAGRQIGMVYQDYMLFPHLTLRRNIAFGLTARKVPSGDIKRKVDRIAELLGISHLLHRYPGSLSGGEQQRGAIARAVVIEPTALLLDEPLSALDEHTAQRLQKELKRTHHVTGATTIHITHRFEEAFVMADRIAVMKNGRIVQQGTPQTIFRRPASRWVAQFVGCKNVFQGNAVQQDGITEIEVQGLTIRSHTPGNGQVYISVRPEDIFISRQQYTEPHLNSLRGIVKGVLDRGRFIEAEIDVGVSLVTILSRQSAHKVGLDIGKEVFITIRVEDVHLFE